MFRVVTLARRLRVRDSKIDNPPATIKKLTPRNSPMQDYLAKHPQREFNSFKEAQAFIDSVPDPTPEESEELREMIYGDDVFMAP